MPHAQQDYPLDLAEMVAWVRGATRSGERVLEIGCGDGAITRRLAGAGVDIVGVDPHADGGGPLHAITLESFDDEPFDVMFASVSLHHLPDPGATVAALRRLSKPGTRMLVREFDAEAVLDDATLRFWYHQRLSLESIGARSDPDHPLPVTYDELRADRIAFLAHHVLPWASVSSTLAEAGFSTEEQWSSAYLFRWGLMEEVRPLEERLIADGRIRQVGIRWLGRRR